MNDTQAKVKSGIDTGADQAKGIVDRVAEQAKGLADRATGVAGQVKHMATDAAESVGEYAHVAKDRVQHLAEEAYDKAGDKLGTLGKDVTTLVRNHPIQALLVGFAVGMLLGRVSRA
jgi:ElaB/YqjD/DUF883 family membrane-anchored ribosome-binding protein